MTILTFTLLLAACGGGTACENPTTVANISLCLGDAWEPVPASILAEKGVPEETLGAFRRIDQQDGRRDNIVLSQEPLPAAVPSRIFADASVRSVESLPEYQLREKRDIEIEGEETFIHIFTARPIPDLPARRFYQLSFTQGSMGFTLTGTLPFSPKEEMEEELLHILLSVEAK